MTIRNLQSVNRDKGCVCIKEQNTALGNCGGPQDTGRAGARSLWDHLGPEHEATPLRLATHCLPGHTNLSSMMLITSNLWFSVVEPISVVSHRSLFLWFISDCQWHQQHAIKSSIPWTGPHQREQWFPPDCSAWKSFHLARFLPQSMSGNRHLFPETVHYTTT